MDASYVLIANDKPPKTPTKEEKVTPPTRSFAHDWSDAGTGGGLRLKGRHLIDGFGRVCLPRGTNLSGNCKTPSNRIHLAEKEDEREIVTFVGRPFPLSEAHEHLARLRRWGLTFIRFLVTWEAIEHAGPGIYDQEYLQYLHDLLSLFPQYQLSAYISMHQDVWSRYTGGSGAPAWTLEAVGFDLSALEEAGAAWLGGVRGQGHEKSTMGLWPTGYHKLAAATMATVFWSGDMFAPRLQAQDPRTKTDVPIQQFLQSTFLNCWKILAEKIGRLEGVMGFQLINEPHPGYFGQADMHGYDYNTNLHFGEIPSPLQSFALGSGHPQVVKTWTRSWPLPTKQTTQRLVNPGGRTVWRPNGPTGGRCIWEAHGVWGWDTKKKEPVVLRENYFMRDPRSTVSPEKSKDLDWYRNFYLPYYMTWAKMVHEITGGQKLLFAEPIPNEFCPPQWTAEFQPPNMVYAPHWYDLRALFEREFGNVTFNVQGLAKGMFFLRAMYWGHSGAQDNYHLQIRNITEAGYRSLPEKPVIIGECGVPFDMNNREAFKTGDFSWQLRMMDALCAGLERSLVGFNLWNYNQDNDDNLGDDWCGENFSWFSNNRARPIQQPASVAQTDESLDQGGRILRAVVRPYPAKVAGIPLEFNYDINTGSFIFKWTCPGSNGAATKKPVLATIGMPPLDIGLKITRQESEFFIPSMFTKGRKLVVSGWGITPEHWEYNEDVQTLYVRNVSTVPGHVHRIHVTLDPPLEPVVVVTSSIWESKLFYACVALLLALLMVMTDPFFSR